MNPTQNFSFRKIVRVQQSVIYSVKIGKLKMLRE